MSEQHDLVSIIVPVYGTEAYLPACVDSIRKQTYENLQIILVDDQSPDGCPEICDRYAEQDERITVIHQANKGVSGARNAGLRSAAGDYIMFVDSDDELYSDAVDLLLNDARTYGADVVSATKRVVDSSGHVVSSCEDGEVSVYRDEGALLLSLDGDKNTNSACAKLFRAEFIRDCSFDEGKHINEDGFFIFMCYLKEPVLVQHNIAIYQYNVVEGSNSRNRFSDKYLSMLYFCDRKRELIESRYPQYIEQAYNMQVRTNLQFLQVLCRTNDKKYRNTHKESVKTVRRLYRYHKPIHAHHKKLAWIVAHGLYPVYKAMVRLKYYR